jgi:hypothetical protein
MSPELLVLERLRRDLFATLRAHLRTSPELPAVERALDAALGGIADEIRLATAIHAADTNDDENKTEPRSPKEQTHVRSYTGRPIGCRTF